MDEEYRKKNLDDCDMKIAGFEFRLKAAKITGEDSKELQKSLKGYQDARKRFIKA